MLQEQFNKYIAPFRIIANAVDCDITFLADGDCPERPPANVTYVHLQPSARVTVFQCTVHNTVNNSQCGATTVTRQYIINVINTLRNGGNVPCKTI